MEPNLPQQNQLRHQPWFDRNGFEPWVVALLWVLISFILFQIGGGIFAVIGFLISPQHELSPEILEQLGADMDLIFWANSISQILFLGLGTWIFARLSVHRDQQVDFFRFRIPQGTWEIAFLTAVVIMVMQPIVWMLSWLNMQLPVPDPLSEFEMSQMEMIRTFLTGDHILVLTLFHVALVPAVCEEVLYRGYILRLLERSWGIIAAIFVCGLIFGLYHLRLTQLMPLAIIGMFLAWVTIKSGSLIPAIVGHFVNNAGSIIAASISPELIFEEEVTMEMPSLWLLLISIIFTSALLMYIMYIAQSSSEKKETL